MTSSDYNFNSIKVRLELVRHAAREKSGCNFNSIKVRLERLLLRYIVKVLIFQFHKGTIRTTILTTLTSSTQNFNSIKVRLELGALLHRLYDSTFQFHKGTIRTDDVSPCEKAAEISIP